MDSCATHACWLLLTGRPAKLQPVYKAVLVETVFWKPSPASVRQASSRRGIRGSPGLQKHR